MHKDNILIIRQALATDMTACSEIESLSYGSEGASIAQINQRLLQYSSGFYVLTLEDKVVGFINSCCTMGPDLSDEEIKNLIGHDPQGRYLIILSLATHPDLRQQGIATKLLHHFNKQADYWEKDILLMCKEELITFYQRRGFSFLRQSASNHGGIDWFEMQRKYLAVK